MTTTHSAAPVGGRERIHSLNVVRGVALFGILLINILSFGMRSADRSVFGGHTGVNLWVWITTEMLFEGTQRGLFSILFGAGFIVLTSRLEAASRTDVADICYRRSLWLIAFGLVDAYILLWFGDVLYFYGTTALMLYPLRKLSPKVMLGMAAAALLAGTLWSLGELKVTWGTWERAQAAQAIATRGNMLTAGAAGGYRSLESGGCGEKARRFTLRKDIRAHHGSY